MVDGNRRTRSTADRLWNTGLALRRHLVKGMENGLSALSAMELTVPQTMVLFRLVEVGPLTISELQRVAGRSQAATSHLVEQLESRKLAARKDDPRDGRRTLVHPTPKAIALAGQVQGLRRKSFDAALQRLPPPVLKQLDEALLAVLTALEETS